jgi:hypothetical protein
MSEGYAHIIRLGDLTAGSSALAPQYQFTFNDGNRNFGRVFNDVELLEFLADDLGLTNDVIDTIAAELRDHGTATVSQLSISENQASAMGLNVVQSEY